MHWVREFYEKQNEWFHFDKGDVSDAHREKAALIEEFVGSGPKRVLELGAGTGHVAAAMADLGHTVTAVELVPTLAAHAQKLASSRTSQKMGVINDDFYAIPLEDNFDVVCYWDGFGIGTDDDQWRLLQRIASWLAPTGYALMDIGTPWYAASVDGRGWEVGEAERQYSFDADGCRWEDTWWPKGQPDQAVKQSIRCYSPADFRMLLVGTGLKLVHVKPGGTMDWEEGKWLPSVPLKKSMFYTVQVGPSPV
ncbi:MAG: methyltransferase domain-containing protein [Chloroflexota bacterium]